MAQKQNWFITLAVVVVIGAIAPHPCLAEATQSKTDISFLGNRFSLKTSLDGLWQYQAGDELGGYIIVSRNDEMSGRRRSQFFVVSGKKLLPDTTQEKAAEVDWALTVLRYTEELEWGNEALLKMGDAKLRTLDLFGKRFFTHRAKLRVGPRVSMHLFYYVLFPDEFQKDGVYYGFEYMDFRHRAEEGSVSALPLHDVISGFSLDPARASSKSTVTWSIGGNEHVVINALEQERTFYFNNNNSRQCFAFSADGLWHATDEAGLLGAADEQGFIGVLLLSEEDVQDFEGDDFLSRVASAQQQRHGEEAQETTMETFDCCLPNAIKSTGRWTVKRKSSRRRGRFEKYEEILLKRVRYIAEVKPGWATVVTASSTVDGDDMARSILESLRLSDAPGCFNDEIAQLRR